MMNVETQIDISKIHSAINGPGTTGPSSSAGFVEDMTAKMQARMEEDEDMYEKPKDKGKCCYQAGLTGNNNCEVSKKWLADMLVKLLDHKMIEDLASKLKVTGAGSCSCSGVCGVDTHGKKQAKMGEHEGKSGVEKSRVLHEMLATIENEIRTSKRNALRGLVDEFFNIKLQIALETNDHCQYMPLYKATLAGDWEATKQIIEGNSNAVTAAINHASMTVLQIAVEAGKTHLHFVKKLVDFMPEKDLEVQNNSGNTALSMAAIVGNTAAAKILVKKNPNLRYICNVVKYLPVHEAAVHGHKETLVYLREVTQGNREPYAYQGEVGFSYLLDVMAAEFYDVAFDLIEEYPELATTNIDGFDSPLTIISRNASVFHSGTRLSWWERLVYSVLQVKLEKRCCEPNNVDTKNASSPPQAHGMQVYANICFKAVYEGLHLMLSEGLGFFVPHIKDKKLVNSQAHQLVKLLCEKIRSTDSNKTYVNCTREAIIEATKNGIPEVIEEIADKLPLAIWSRAIGKGLFQLAVANRCEKVFNLIYQMRDHKHQILTHQDDSGNNILHLAGKLAPPHKLNLVSGAALQMQREIQWYKEVKKHVSKPGSQKRNSSGNTPEMVFTEKHKQLVVDGEKWMKDTATSCTIAAALIVTMVFAAAITVPGGLDQETGNPIFSERSAFKLFFISNAISLFTSTTSLLMFLSILTARYAEEDFHLTLPNRLIIGLLTLFLSTTTMMISFSSILYLFFGQGNAWSIVPTIGLACLPITSFVTLQFPLLVDLISSTYGRGIFGRQSRRSIY